MTSEDTTYNGWSNYPTWAVNLWLSNDEPLYNETRDRARSIRDDAVGDEDAERSVPYLLAEDLKNWVSDELSPDLGASFAADLMGWALGQVDWDELAASWLEDLA